jgi:hypothetical protein
MVWRASRCKTGLVQFGGDKPARKLPAMVSQVFPVNCWAFFPGNWLHNIHWSNHHVPYQHCNFGGFIPHFRGPNPGWIDCKNSLTWKIVTPISDFGIVTPIQLPFPEMCSLGTQSRCLAAAGRGGPPSPARKDHLESFMQQIPDWESLCEHKSIKFIRSPTSMLFQQVTWICKRINNLLDPQNGPQRKCKIVKVFQTRTKSLKKSKNRI